jgi:predicted nucleic acid-binding Zn finger protein
VVTKFDNWFNVATTIDVSAIIGKTSGGAIVGYEPANGRYHIWVYIAGASRWYVFSDSTFATCVANYTASNLTGWTSQNLYIYDTKAYQFNGPNVRWVDYVNNISWTILAAPLRCNANPLELANFNYGTCPISGSIVAGGYGIAIVNTMGVLLDISTGTYVGHIMPPVGWGNNQPAFKVPLLETNAVTATSSSYYGNSGLFTSATAAYKLPTPVIKTSANGMTVTYELEVFW